MSLNIYLTMQVDTGGASPHKVTLLEANITHNVRGMWAEAGVAWALYEGHGTLAGYWISALEAGVADMERSPTKYEAMNPENGWGSYERALPWLRDVLKMFRIHPNATIEVSQ